MWSNYHRCNMTGVRGRYKVRPARMVGVSKRTISSSPRSPILSSPTYRRPDNSSSSNNNGDVTYQCQQVNRVVRSVVRWHGRNSSKGTSPNGGARYRVTMRSCLLEDYLCIFHYLFLPTLTTYPLPRAMCTSNCVVSIRSRVHVCL